MAFRVFNERTYFMLMFRTLGKRKKTFRFAGREYRYLYHHHNTTWLNERTVEVPVGKAQLDRFKPEDVLEVGNVTKNYFPNERHVVLDKYERAPGIINEDIIGFNPGRTFKLVLSISTIEHVGHDEADGEKDLSKCINAINHITDKLVERGGEFWMTFPHNWNPTLDDDARLRRIFTEVRYMKRLNVVNEWQEASWEQVKDLPYGSPDSYDRTTSFRNANAIGILVFRK